ncbi:adenylate/guanylate cyclase domain-containing protein [Croceicoccus ponticola]|uniref:Adenylate/guanylate cyclase domain-containing protein n=1 Tax=Croceicoccus ponticola TaxID=2217664 RepID=A0A437GWA8_9SPHN|nr:adenylate/guanylate cyclase domain-containing protein [Croceicoccus ponticola]RVQ66387.1 adenylate/guanylate cyclase domain-containing protein [Croceicoccus ponticola]
MGECTGNSMVTHLKWLGKTGPVLIGLSTLALVVLLQFVDLAPLERLRLQVFDGLQLAGPSKDVTQRRVMVADIDEESIKQLGQWPWPRDELATLTRRLGEAGASVVVYDIVFSEPDRTSPAAIAARYQNTGMGEALDERFASLPSHDSLFADSFRQVPVVTGYFLDRVDRGRDVEPKVGFTLHGHLPTRHVRSYAGALQPLPELENAAAGNGFVSLESDADGIVRRVPLVAIQNGTLVPGLSLEAVRLALGAEAPNFLASDGSGETASAPGAAVAVRIGGREIPVTDAGEMWVRFPERDTHEVLPVWQIVTGAIPDDALARAIKGRIVFVGGSAAGLQDLVSTPRSRLTAGVNVHAAAVSQMLDGDFLERPDWAFGLELLLVLVAGGGLALLLPRLGATRGAMAALAGAGMIAGGSWLAFARGNYLLDPTYPMIAIAAVYVVQTVVVFYREERQRRYIHAAFDRYLSPEMVRKIAADPSKLELGGEEREMTVLMCDIRGFSHISERYAPHEVIDFLIDLLTPLSDILLARRATIDKYIGDAILAFWNAPLDDPDQHRNAASAALEMIAKTKELNRTMSAHEGPVRNGTARNGKVWPGDVRIGLGLNSGLCCVGNMGSRQRLSYTLIGDTVNVASRFEGLTKLYGVSIIVGSALAAELQRDFALLELDRVRVVGRDAPETIFALLGDGNVFGSESFARLRQAHAAMLEAYHAQQWGTAREALVQGRTVYEEYDIVGLNDLFQQRVATLEANPPAAGWDGVFQVTQK